MKYKDFKIRDYDYIGSAIGNAYFSGMNFDELWSCVEMSNNREELDASISVVLELKEICKKNAK